MLPLDASEMAASESARWNALQIVVPLNANTAYGSPLDGTERKIPSTTVSTPVNSSGWSTIQRLPSMVCRYLILMLRHARVVASARCRHASAKSGMSRGLLEIRVVGRPALIVARLPRRAHRPAPGDRTSPRDGGRALNGAAATFRAD